MAYRNYWGRSLRSLQKSMFCRLVGSCSLVAFWKPSKSTVFRLLEFLKKLTEILLKINVCRFVENVEEGLLKCCKILVFKVIKTAEPELSENPHFFIFFDYRFGSLHLAAHGNCRKTYGNNKRAFQYLSS